MSKKAERKKKERKRAFRAAVKAGYGWDAGGNRYMALKDDRMLRDMRAGYHFNEMLS